MCTGQNAGSVSPACWRLRRFWSSACGDGIVASGRSVWTKNQPRDIRRRRERSVSEGARPRQEGWESSISASGGVPRLVYHCFFVDVPCLIGDVVALFGCDHITNQTWNINKKTMIH